MKELHLILEDLMQWCQSQTPERVEKITILMPERVLNNFFKQALPKEKIALEGGGDALAPSRISRMWVNSGIVELRDDETFEVKLK